MSTKLNIKVGARQFTDLVYADDTTFFALSASDDAECLQTSTAHPQYCETTVSLATYNNQIHRQITQNALKLIKRRK